jgi:hypothetical protein
VSPVRYELDFYIPVDGILHSNRRKISKSYIEASCSKSFLQVELVHALMEFHAYRPRLGGGGGVKL